MKRIYLTAMLIHAFSCSGSAANTPPKTSAPVSLPTVAPPSFKVGTVAEFCGASCRSTETTRSPGDAALEERILRTTFDAILSGTEELICPEVQVKNATHIIVMTAPIPICGSLCEQPNVIEGDVRDTNPHPGWVNLLIEILGPVTIGPRRGLLLACGTGVNSAGDLYFSVVFDDDGVLTFLQDGTTGEMKPPKPPPSGIPSQNLD